MNENLIFLDTSVISTTYCYSEREGQKKKLTSVEAAQAAIKTEENFSILMAMISEQLPGFENDYVHVKNVFLALECSGGGDINKKTYDKFINEYETCFMGDASIDDILKMEISDNDKASLIDSKFNKILNKLNNFYMQHIDINDLIKLATEKVERFDWHENIIVVRNDLQEWITCLQKNGIVSPYFKTVCGWLAWDAFLRYDCWTTNEENKKHILFLIAGYYLAIRKDWNCPGAVLFGKMNEKILFDSFSEILDPYLLEFLFMGYLSEPGTERKPVIVMTAERKRLDDRLEFYVLGALKLRACVNTNEILQSKKFDFVPGILIVIDRKNPSQVVKVIRAEEIIKRIENKIISNNF